jgi:AcrR family transcriptional regulator
MSATITAEAPSGTHGPRRTQEQRRERTRTALLDATIETLLERGYSRTTTAEVCVRAGVSQGALFKHFATKQALLASSVEHLYDRLLRRYTEQMGKTDAGPTRPIRPNPQSAETYISDAIDALWRTFEQPELSVAYELQAASRTDPDLRDLLKRVGESHASAIRRTASELFPEVAAGERFAPLLDTVLETFQGMAMSRMIAPDPDHETRVLGVLKSFARDAFEHDKREAEDAGSDPGSTEEN